MSRELRVNRFTTTAQGLVPAPGTATGKVLTDDGTWQTPSGGGSGTVTSVSLADASTNPIYTVTGSPVTTSGTLTETLKTQNANLAFLGPASGAAAQPGFRAIGISDVAAALGSVGFPTNTSLPGTIPTLCYWFDASTLLSGLSFYPIATNQAPAAFLYSGNVVTGTMQVSATLNGLNVATLNGASTYVLPGSTGGITLANLTIFVVLKPTLLPSSGTLFGCTANNTIAYFVNASNQLSLLDSGIAVIGASSAVLTTATFVQANVAWNGATGAFAFRQGRTATGSGTSAHPILAGAAGIFCTSTTAGTTSNPLNAQVAELIIYNSVLSGGNITAIENYLFAKWGV